MAVRVNFNEAAAQTHTALIRNERAMNKSLLRLSTGMRILNAADDSAGLFIADMLGTVAKAYDQGNRNIQTGISALQIAENSAGQIYEKLQEIYVRAQNAANDINDPNARNALQREISNFVDAIQKIGKDTEYNGIKLLDGNFTSKSIHYGARRDQVVNLSFGSLKAEDLGAYISKGTGKSTNEGNYIAKGTGSATGQNAASNTSFSSWISGLGAYWVDSGDYFKVNGIDVVGTSGRIVDAYEVAYNINNNASLLSQGISATATNISTAANSFTNAVQISITGSGTDTASSATVTTTLYLNFYVGNDASSSAFSISSQSSFTHSGTNSSSASFNLFGDLTSLVNDINNNKGTTSISVTSTSDGKLRLTTTNGQTIGMEARLEVDISTTDGGSATAAATINLNQLLQGGQSVTTGNISDTGSTTRYASAVKVGDLVINSPDDFNVNSSGVDALGTVTKSIAIKNSYPFSSWIQFVDSTNYWVNSGDYFKVNGINVLTASDVNKILDASVVANRINNQATLKEKGIEAKATNISTANGPFERVARLSLSANSGVGNSVTARLHLNFYVGNNTTAAFSITSAEYSVSNGQTSDFDVFTDLDDLVSQINTLASNNNTPIVAEKTVDGKLRLRTTNGETIGIEAKLDVQISGTAAVTTSTIINLDQLLQGGLSNSPLADIDTSGTHYASAVNVGELVIGSPDNFTLEQNGVDALGLSSTSVNRKNLYSIDVTSNLEAEEAIMIATKALQRTDTIRAYIGATMNNLQSIFDSQKVAYDNTKEAESVIRNTDYAKEMSEFTTYQIRMQSTIAMLGQANTLPQLVLQLLR